MTLENKYFNPMRSFFIRLLLLSLIISFLLQNILFMQIVDAKSTLDVNNSNRAKTFLEVGEKPLLTFVQITDIHLESSSDDGSLDAFIRDINNQKEFPLPDFVVTTGDNTEDGTEEQLKTFKKKMDILSIPYYPIVAGHDTLSESGPKKGRLWANVFGRDKFSYTWTIGDFLFIAADDDAEFGGFGRTLNDKEHRTWLKKVLDANPGKKGFLFYHRSLAPCRDAGGAADYWMDDSKKIQKILESDGNIIAAFSGHSHINGVSANKGGIYYITTASLYSVYNEYRYVRVYSDRIESRIFSLRNNIKGDSRLKWPGATDSVHPTTLLYHIGIPQERNFKIDFTAKSLDGF